MAIGAGQNRISTTSMVLAKPDDMATNHQPKIQQRRRIDNIMGGLFRVAQFLKIVQRF